jgi:hypothetical protein
MRKFILALMLTLAGSPALAFDEVYCDPAIAGNSGSGTIGDPYGDVQHALDTKVHGGTGMRLNIKAGTAEILAAAINLTAYVANNGAVSATEPLLLRGYTAAAGDGGIGEISGVANSVAVWGQTDADNVSFRQLKMTAANAGDAIDIDNFILIMQCEIINGSGTGVDIDDGLIYRCKISAAGRIIDGSANANVECCHLVQTGGNIVGSVAGSFEGCIVDVRNATSVAATVLDTPSSGATRIVNNTIIGPSSAGSVNLRAIYVNVPSVIVRNNYIQGFDSSTGEAIDVPSASVHSIIEGNRYFDCTAGITDAGINTITDNNSATSASGVTNLAGGDITPTAELINAGSPTAFYLLSGNANAPTVGAIESEASGGNVVDPLSGSIPGL